VRRLYGCTNAEARLVVALVDGASLREAAAALGVRYETARTTLKSAFGKLGVTSQARLIARVLRDLPP
jgi:DNA-binding CsgD family transcriptional regulator